MEVYVIYKDGELYHSRGRKSSYLKESNARQVITTESKNDVYCNSEQWHELSRDDIKNLIEKAKSHYEIRIFRDSGEVV